MYIVANPSKNEVSLTDLGISIPPHKSVDLHEIKVLIPPEKSKHLEIAKKKGFLKVIRQDVIISVSSDEEKKPAKENPSINQNELTKAIREEIQKTLSNSNTKVQTEEGKNDKNALVLEEILKKLNQLSSLSSDNKNNSNSKSSTGVDDQGELENNIDDEILSSIHKKAVEKMTKNVERSSLEYEKQNIQDSSVAKNISELEDLLG